MENFKKYVWCVAYINRAFLSTITRDLDRFSNGGIKSYIPTVKVLRKQFKGKKYFDEVPMLFNYGFFRIPFEDACNRDFLMRLKVAVQGIYNWLYTNEVPEKNEAGHFYNAIQVSTVKVKEMVMLKRAALLNSIYSASDINGVGKDDYIVLHGYPFENIPAQVISVNAKKELVKVKLLLDNNNLFNEVEVSFSNVFYSIYSSFDDPTTSDYTLDAMKRQVSWDDFRKEVIGEFE